MPKTQPLPNWSDEDVYIIGGGPSLRNFDFDQLRGLNTIGCNQAFILGAERCNICIFGDWLFWERCKDALEDYGGWVATNYGTPEVLPPWLHRYDRLENGLCGPEDRRLAWNGNTGCLAINLALLLGAARVLLLGVDLGANGNGKTHWHDKQLEQARGEHYRRFAEGYATIARSLNEKFPGRKVLNVSNGKSKLECFPILQTDEVFSGEGVVA